MRNLKQQKTSVFAPLILKRWIELLFSAGEGLHISTKLYHFCKRRELSRSFSVISSAKGETTTCNRIYRISRELYRFYKRRELSRSFSVISSAKGETTTCNRIYRISRELYRFYKRRELSRSCSVISSGKERNYDV